MVGRRRGAAVTVARAAATGAAVSVMAVAAAATFVRLGTPADLVFDEVYYVEDARGLRAGGVEPGFAVHPPLGKWVVAAGMQLVGDTPVGWRLGGALLAVAAVAITIDLGRRLSGRTWVGVAAGALLALDGLWLVMARTAMLDTVAASLVVAGTHLVVVDHQRRPHRPGWWSRWPLLLGGATFGAAVATKWSGALALAGAVALVLGWELTARRRTPRGDVTGPEAAEPGDGTPGTPTTSVTPDRGRRHLGVAVAAVTLVPLAVYTASFAPWVVHYPRTATAAADCAGDETACPLSTRLAGLVRWHQDVAGFHLTLDAEHPYRAPATTWPTLGRPVVHFYESCDEAGRDGEGAACVVAGPGRAAEIVGLGNPALWWSGLALVPVAAVGLRRRDAGVVVPLTLLAVQFLPWLVAARPVFTFYAVTLVPFLAVAVALGGHELGRTRGWRRIAPAVVLAAAVAGGGVTLTGAAWPAVATAALVAATGAAALAGRGATTVDDRARAVGPVVVGMVVAAAVVLFGYFSPLWFAVPVPEEVLRARWWLPGWV